MLCTCYHRRFALARAPLFRPSAARRNFTNTVAVCSNPPLSPPASSTIPTFSTPFTTPPPKNISEKKEKRTSSPSSTSTPPSPSTLSDAEDEPAEQLRSKTKVGAVLRGMNYFKDKQNPVAEEDDKYPDWLWSLLDEVEGAGGKDSEAETKADMYSKSKKKRRQAMQKARAALLNPQSAKIPYEHQTIDLPTFDLNDLDTTEHKEGRDEVDPNVPRQMQHEAQMAAQRAQRAREELVHAMRKERKKGIKESNFLKSMKM